MAVVIFDRSEIYLLFVFIFVLTLGRNERRRHMILSVTAFTQIR